MRRINEALQYLQKKRNKSKAADDWLHRGHKGQLVAKTVNCFMYDEEKAKLRSEQLKIEYENALYAKERESKKAMELATELTDSLNKKRFEKNTIVCIF